MNCIHGNKSYKIVEYNLLHDILNPSKRTKNLKIHYSPILHGCMNTQKGRANFKNFLILLYSGCSYMILMGRLIRRLTPKKDAVIQWHIQAGGITTNLKVKTYFTFTGLSATKRKTRNCHVDDSTKVRYHMILGRYLLIYLGLNLKLSDHVIEADDGPFKGYTAPMVSMGT